MSSVAAHRLKSKANTAATSTICMAVALTEPSAAKASFQRHQPSLPPTQNAISAPYSLKSAGHFSGSIAKYAVNAVTTATF